MTFYAEEGDLVSVHYCLSYTNGEIYDNTYQKQPLIFKLGTRAFISGFEDAIKTMKIGDTKTITIKSKDAFGARDTSLIQDIPIENVPDHIHKKVGQKVSVQLTKDSWQTLCIITKVSDTHVTLDANLPQSDKDFLLKVTLLNLDVDPADLVV